MNPKGPARNVALALCLVLALLGAFTFAADAAKRRPQKPDLVVAKLGDPPAQLSPGSSFTVKDTTKNVGKGKARASRTAYFLSMDREPGHGDVAVGNRTIGSLKPGKSATGSAKLTVPASAGAGTYYLLACADAAKAVKESSENDNCRASARATKVAASDIPPPGFFPRPSHPVTVNPVPETSNAASALISSDGGGTLTANGADGVKYTLSVPAGALVSDETITMTPVSSIGGFPLGSLIGAVEITPHGIQLLKPATLTIVPTSPIQLSSQAAFDAYEGGEDFGLYPLDSGNGIVLTLNHFSTYGAAEATDAQVQQLLSNMPARTQAQYQQLAGELFRKAREKEQPVDADALAGLFAGYYRDIVKPLTDKAVTDDSYSASAVTELLEWANELEVLGLRDHPYVKSEFEAVHTLLERILKNALQQSYQRCIAKDDLSEIVRLLSATRQAQILGVNLGDASQLAQKCGHLELDVTMTSELVTNTGDQRITADIGVEDDVPIAVNEANQFQGEKDPTYTNWQIAIQFGCCVTADKTLVDSPSRVGVALDYNAVERKDPATGRIIRTVPSPTLRLRFDPGQTREQYTLSGGGGTYYDTLWNDTWRDGHLTELVEGQARIYELTGWQTFPPGSGPLLATKSYPTRTVCHHNRPGCTPGADNITETTTLKLYHRPQS